MNVLSRWYAYSPNLRTVLQLGPREDVAVVAGDGEINLGGTAGPIDHHVECQWDDLVYYTRSMGFK